MVSGINSTCLHPAPKALHDLLPGYFPLVFFYGTPVSRPEVTTFKGKMGPIKRTVLWLTTDFMADPLCEIH